MTSELLSQSASPVSHRELGVALDETRKQAKRGNMIQSVAAAYLEFAASSLALYEVMFPLGSSVPFGAPRRLLRELRFAFTQRLELFQGQSSKPEARRYIQARPKQLR